MLTLFTIISVLKGKRTLDLGVFERNCYARNREKASVIYFTREGAIGGLARQLSMAQRVIDLEILPIYLLKLLHSGRLPVHKKLKMGKARRYPVGI